MAFILLLTALKHPDGQTSEWSFRQDFNDMWAGMMGSRQTVEFVGVV